MKKKTFSVVFTAVATAFFVIIVSPRAFLAQERTGASNTTAIELRPGAGQNSYSLSESRGKVYLTVANVVDPTTGKLLELIREVEIRLRQTGEKVKKPMRFQRGNAGPMLIPYEPDDDMVVTVLVVNRLRVVPLAKDAERNGYETSLVGTLFDLKAKNVRDPVTDKVLKTIEEIRVKCLINDPPVIKTVPFSNGNSTTAIRIRCAAPYSAEVFILK